MNLLLYKDSNLCTETNAFDKIEAKKLGYCSVCKLWSLCFPNEYSGGNENVSNECE